MFKILVITDGKLSSLNQCNSIINELKIAKKVKLRYIKIKKSFFHFFPNSFIYLKLLVKLFCGWNIEKDKINLIVSCGRIAAPYNLVFKKIYHCKNLHILNPYFKKEEFTKIIIPKYDSSKFLNKNNLILTSGTLVDREKINLKKKKLLNTSKLFKKNYKILFSDLKKTIQQINKEKKVEIVYCFSRRTSQSIKNKVIENKKKDSLVFPKKLFNPYWDLINIADFIFVTEDSVSMTSDALSTGKPTYIIPISKLKHKIKDFQTDLKNKKITRIYNQKLSIWKYKKFEESKIVIEQIKKILNF